jgi:hypothetical protein
LECKKYIPDFRLLANLVKEFPYNPKALEEFTFTCFDPEQSYINNELRLIYNEPEALDVRSSYGQVMTAKLDDTNVRPFIVKTLKIQDDDEYDEEIYNIIRIFGVVHEAFVGLYVTNKLRTVVPNFMYTFGYAEGTKPAKNEHIYRWLTNRLGKKRSPLTCYSLDPDSFCPYVFLERIADSPSITEAKLGAKSFLNVYIQVLLAINYAYKAYKFTHYDLHGGNVLIRRLDRNYYIKYPLGETNVYVYADLLPVIIDYGLARVEIDGKVYGPCYYIDDKRHNARDYAYPYHDAYKLLGNVLYSMRKTNKFEYNSLEWLFRFFSKENMDEAIELQVQEGYSLPLKYPFVNRSLDDLIDYIRKKQPDLLLTSKPDDGVVFSCDYLTCTTPTSTAVELPSILRLYHYYNLLSHGVDVKLPNIEQDLNLAIDKIRTDLEHIKTLDLTDIVLPTSTEVFSRNTYRRIANSIDKINIIVDKVRDVVDLYNISLSLSKGYPHLQQTLTSLETEIHNIYTSFIDLQYRLDDFRRRMEYSRPSYYDEFPKYYKD